VEVRVIKLTAVMIYLSGLAFAEALRLPRRIGRIRNRKAWSGMHSPPRLLELFVIAAIILGIWALPMAYAFTNWLRPFDYSLPKWTVWVAVIVFVISLAIRWEAQRSLASQWSFTLETVEDQALVTSGIYSYTRHPIYLSLVLWAVAQPLLLQNVIAGLAGVVAVLLVWIVRVSREERMMLDKFGEEYIQYMSRTGRFIPRRRTKDQAA